MEELNPFFRLIKNKDLWIISVLIFILGILYYADHFPVIKFLSPQQYLGLTTRSYMRFLFLIPVLLTSRRFGFKAGTLCSLISGLIMTPRAFISPVGVDVATETIVVVAVGMMISWYIDALERAKSDQQLLTAQLQTVNDDLQNQIIALDTAESTVQRQAREILEVSTPVMQVWEGVVVAPLIGTLDSERTQQFMERILNTVVETRSPVALIDITGVPIIDTQTGQHLIEAILAARLLGTEVILTGVSPLIAQTLVHLGIDLSKFKTKSSLSAGLRVALDALSLRVVARERS
jgi:anti-anti-sigma regulatory factor